MTAETAAPRHRGEHPGPQRAATDHGRRARRDHPRQPSQPRRRAHGLDPGGLRADLTHSPGAPWSRRAGRAAGRPGPLRFRVRRPGARGRGRSLVLRVALRDRSQRNRRRPGRPATHPARRDHAPPDGQMHLESDLTRDASRRPGRSARRRGRRSWGPGRRGRRGWVLRSSVLRQILRRSRSRSP